MCLRVGVVSCRIRVRTSLNPNIQCTATFISKGDGNIVRHNEYDLNCKENTTSIVETVVLHLRISSRFVSVLSLKVTLHSESKNFYHIKHKNQA